MSLQYGVPLEVYVSKFSHTRFEPMGHTKNPDIRIAKSIVDYIFRWLGIEFLPGYREAMLGYEAAPAAEDAEAEPKLAAKKAGELKGANGSAEKTAAVAAPVVAEKPATVAAPAAKKTNGAAKVADKPAGAATDTASLLERAGVMKVDLNGGGFTNRAEQFASFQTDAPSCDNCGAITVRNGNCYLCHNCGNSMGCS
jgi:ribonucleoside-diphosphate reductase alpha chain